LSRVGQKRVGVAVTIQITQSTVGGDRTAQALAAVGEMSQSIVEADQRGRAEGGQEGVGIAIPVHVAQAHRGGDARCQPLAAVDELTAPAVQPDLVGAVPHQVQVQVRVAVQVRQGRPGAPRAL
jgi:hypothetical protein